MPVIINTYMSKYDKYVVSVLWRKEKGVTSLLLFTFIFTLFNFSKLLQTTREMQFMAGNFNGKAKIAVKLITLSLNNLSAIDTK